MNGSASGITDSPPSYVLVLSLEYRPAEAVGAASWEQRLAAFESQHLGGRRFAAYTEHTGAQEKIYVLAPLQSPATTHENRSEAATDARTRETFAALNESVKSSVGFVTTFIPELSNASGIGHDEPSAYVFLISARMKGGVGEEIKSLAREAGLKIVAAHRQHAQGRHFVTYHSYSEADDVFHVAVPLDRFDELDDWIGYGTLLREVYGVDEAARLLEVINQVIASSASRVGKRHSSDRNLV